MLPSANEHRYSGSFCAHAPARGGQTAAAKEWLCPPLTKLCAGVANARLKSAPRSRFLITTIHAVLCPVPAPVTLPCFRVACAEVRRRIPIGLNEPGYPPPPSGTFLRRVILARETPDLAISHVVDEQDAHRATVVRCARARRDACQPVSCSGRGRGLRARADRRRRDEALATSLVLFLSPPPAWGPLAMRRLSPELRTREQSWRPVATAAAAAARATTRLEIRRQRQRAAYPV